MQIKTVTDFNKECKTLGIEADSDAVFFLCLKAYADAENLCKRTKKQVDIQHALSFALLLSNLTLTMYGYAMDDSGVWGKRIEVENKRFRQFFSDELKMEGFCDE